MGRVASARNYVYPYALVGPGGQSSSLQAVDKEGH